MTDDDFAHRELCPDGACLGVIGPDGRCKVCGAVGSGPVAGALRDPVADHDDDDEDDGADPSTEEIDGEDDGFEDDRELCPDGACVGVLGADRRCKVCGAAAP